MTVFGNSVVTKWVIFSGVSNEGAWLIVGSVLCSFYAGCHVLALPKQPKPSGGFVLCKFETLAAYYVVTPSHLCNSRRKMV